MKTPIFGVVLGSALLVLFGSCRSKGLDNETRNPLRLAASQTDFADSVNGETKATEAKFQNGDAVGVFVHTAVAVAASGNHSANMKYFTIDAGRKWSASSSLSGTLNVGSTYYSTAYYPYKQGVSNPTSVNHTVELDQSIAAGDKATNLEQSDFMIAPGSAIDIKSPTSANVVLNFKHVLTKLVVSVGIPSTIENVKTISVKSVRIKGLNISCRVNLANGVVTPTSIAVTEDITPRLCSGNGTPGTLSSWEAIVIPQEVAPNTKMVEFICTMEDGKDKTLTYTTSALSSLKLTSGNKTTLTLSSSADLAFLSTVSFTDGSAKTDTELQIKATASTPWSVTSSAPWLTLATTAGGSYAATISGVGTGNPQSVFLKVDANTSALAIPREATLTLSNNIGGTMEYKVFQNYTNFAPPTTGLKFKNLGGEAQAFVFQTNTIWTIDVANVSADPINLAISTTANGAPLTLPHEVIGSLAENSLFVQVATANETNVERTGKLILEVKNSSPRQFFEIPVMQESKTVLIGGKEWCAGNLIADGPNKCKIGMPEDMGLLFQFGSLIGSPDGSTASTKAIAVKPVAYTGTTWGSAYTSSGGIGSDNPTAGKGDPCRYYLGADYRLPTTAEQKTLLDVGFTFSGGWTASDPGYATVGGILKFRTAGYRAPTSGDIWSFASCGCFWSSSTNNTQGRDIDFDDNSFEVTDSGREYGQSVRCVKN